MKIYKLLAKNNFYIILKKGAVNISLPVTHQLISSYAGLVRETVSLEMKKFRDRKIIDYSRNSLTILSLQKLEEISQSKSDEIAEVIV